MAVPGRLREVAVVRRGNRTDWILLVALLVLSGFGLLMIFSATRAGGTFSMERQMIFVAVGLLIFLVVSNIDYREYRSMIPAAVGLILVLLVVVLFLPPINNVNRWIRLGSFNLQTAEFAKVVVIITLAAFLTPENRDRDDLTPRTLSWRKFGGALAIVAIPAFLILRAPDLGTAMVFGFILVSMLFLAGATWRQMVTLLSGILIGAVAILRLDLLSDYQQARLNVLFDQDLDPQGMSYQLLQSKNAIGSGQLFGRGLFEGGTLTAFEYVPEQETDFIFTAVGEQLGFVGGVLVLAVFAVIVWRLMVIAAHARDRFGALIAAGVASMMVFHVVVNIGMTVGIMPVTGLPLPFLSQGGSFYMAMTLAVGIANSVWLMRTPVPGENQLT